MVRRASGRGERVWVRWERAGRRSALRSCRVAAGMEVRVRGVWEVVVRKAIWRLMWAVMVI